MGSQDVESGRLAGSVLRCIERLCAQNDMEYRQTRRALRKAEETMAQKETETTPPDSGVQAAQPEAPQQPELPSQILTQLDALNRKLAEANLELRRYETRMFAYERAMHALKQENAELEALCQQARQGEPIPPEPQPSGPVLDQPGLPVIRFAPESKENLRREEAPDPEAEPFFDEGRPPHPDPLREPKTPLDHLSVQLLNQFDQMIRTNP